ncbi:MAG: glycoside hydrolase family 3 N-terminal domain-containing protein [Chloroflexota bacterium]
MKSRRAVSFFLQSALVIVLLASALPAHAQTSTPPAVASQMLAGLTPEERVGQLFLVTFEGTNTDAESKIYDLIVNYHIGGVIMLAGNDNFVPAPDTIPAAHDLISRLQQIEWDSASASEAPPPAYVPLFVGIEQDGDGYPSDQILSGLTALPNVMALGATWKPELAGQIAEIQGQELAALGFNLYLGPSLDVLESPNPSARGDLGPHSFGGDPYWVGRMAQAYVSGLHTGSQGRLLVVPKHFPGLGAADRRAEKEVATVRKSLEQLKQVELAPFFAVTGKAPDAFTKADGLLVSHIRYQGFQGNIRATTRPLSFDQQALGEILSLPEIATWHTEGGLVISDDLGSQAVYTFYAPANQGFSPQQVARDAFLAGNDLLYLGNITPGEGGDTYATTVNILNFFVQRYREDPAFAQQVDAAAARILARKEGLFERFTISNVLAPAGNLPGLGQSQQVVFEAARQSATLISPTLQELTAALPSPPTVRDRLLFITDTSQHAQCSDCPMRSSLSMTALQDTVAHLYGSTAGGQVSEARLSSYSFSDLAALLSGAEVPTMVNDINRASWIVLALSDAGLGQPELVSRFLSERQDLLRDKRIILFSFTAPYYFDATDISRLTAYYGLYSKQPEFVDVAARLLYQELPTSGSSPVSIPGAGYDLIEITRPDPRRVISLSLDTPPALSPQGAPVTGTQPAPSASPATAEPTPIPLLRIGDTVYVRTGAILDHNGHTVPDGTVVRFTVLLSGESGGIFQQLDQVTTNGAAQASFALEKPGLVEIRAASEPATLSDVIQIDVTSGEAAVITVIPPIISETVAPTLVPATPVAEDGFVTTEGYPRFGAWLLAMLFIFLGAWPAYWIGFRSYSVRWGWRWGLCALLGGLAGYNYAALGLPGSVSLTLENGVAGLLVVTGGGELLGLALAWLWARRSSG